ncbi:MAG: hypothetical protein VYA84_16855 [Planctomycetota bacterium]|nr:hypothetical protein [Planctomycetota bacterium]
MSIDNDTDTPYQPPELSEEPVAKQETASPKAKPHPVHWWVPFLGYGYIPLMIGLRFISEDGLQLLFFSADALPFLLPLYGLILFLFTAARIQQGTNSVGLTLFQMLSILPPILWGLFSMFALSLL